MSTTSLPSYAAPDLASIPSYTAEPQAYEQRLALNILRARPSGEYTKTSKGGGISLRLYDQDERAALPTYGHGTPIEGSVEIAKPEGVHAVEVKVRFPLRRVSCQESELRAQIKGTLRLKEIAEGGTVTYDLALNRVTLWSKDRSPGLCPTSLAFSLTLPATFNDGKADYVRALFDGREVR